MSLVLTTDSKYSSERRTWTNGKHAHQDTEFTTFFKRDTDNPMGIITPELKQKAFASIGSTLETPCY
jgi:hypothetical protein